MGLAARDIQRIIEQKQKYHTKALSSTAQFGVLDATLDNFDWISFFSDFTLSDGLFSSLVSTLLFDIPFSDLVAPNLLFEVELPTPEEWLRGVKLKLVKIDLKTLLPDLGSILVDPDKFIGSIFESNFAQTFISTRLWACYYGRSRYGDCYIDPIAVRDFLRSTLYAFVKKRGTIETAKAKVEEAAKVLNIHPELARTTFDRLVAIGVVKEQALTWDYGWWDRTLWGEEGSGGRLTFPTYEGVTITVEYDDMIDLQAGGYWDWAVWDYFCWLDETHPYKREGNPLVRIQDAIWSNFRDRITATWMAVANYQTLEEEEKWTRSERVDHYGSQVYKNRYLDRLAESIVESLEPGVDAMRLRLYKVAVEELYSILSNIHRWGNEALLDMTEDERREWWIGKWAKTGLKRETLEALYNKLYTIVRGVARQRVRERIRFLRKRLKWV